MGRVKFRFNSGGSASPGATAGGRVAAMIFGLVFAGMGTVFLVLIARDAWTSWQTRSWTAVRCTILGSEVRQDAKGSKPYRPYIRYRFFSGGVERIDDRWKLKDPAFGDYAQAQAVVDRFPAGSTPTAYLDPSNPAAAVLEHTAPWIVLFALIPLVFVLIGAGVILGMWTGSPSKPQKQQALSEKARVGRGVGIAFFALFFIIGLAVWVPVGVMPMLRLAAAQNWPAVECEIVSSRVREVRGDDSTSYRPDILYRYTYNGREHRSSRYSPYQWSSGKRAGASEIVRLHPPGGKTACYVNPDNPNEALLTRQWSPLTMLLSMIPLVFVLVGAGGMFFVWRHGRRDTGIKPISAAAERGPLSARLSRPATRPGAITLGPKTKPRTKFIGIVLFALFWNGIVSVFVTIAIKGWMSGQGDLCLTAFMIPFVLIGLAAIGAAIHAFLATFNPIPEVTIEKPALALGESADVKWRFTGSTHRIHRLSIRVEAREEATYRRGTDTHTDKHVFHREDVVDTTRPMEIASGKGKLTIPPDKMHAFASANNKIIWELCLHGEISGWPDVKLEFALDVRPLPATGGQA